MRSITYRSWNNDIVQDVISPQKKPKNWKVRLVGFTNHSPLYRNAINTVADLRYLMLMHHQNHKGNHKGTRKSKVDGSGLKLSKISSVIRAWVVLFD